MNDKKRIDTCIKHIKGDFFIQEKNLISAGWIDSFDLIKLISELEKEFEIHIPIENITPNEFDSVESISTLIQKCKS